MLDLNLKQLKASLLTAGNKDARHYLNGVFVELTPSFYRIVSTDGSNMSVFHVQRETNVAPFSLIISRATIEDLPKSTPATVTLKQENGVWFLGALGFSPVDGRFPEYRRVLSMCAKPSGEASHHAVGAFEAFRKIADSVVKKGASVRIWQNGETASAVTIAGAPEYFGVVMPLNTKHVEKHMSDFPAWLKL